MIRDLAFWALTQCFKPWGWWIDRQNNRLYPNDEQD